MNMCVWCVSSKNMFMAYRQTRVSAEARFGTRVTRSLMLNFSGAQANSWDSVFAPNDDTEPFFRHVISLGDIPQLIQRLVCHIRGSYGDQKAAAATEGMMYAINTSFGRLCKSCQERSLVVKAGAASEYFDIQPAWLVPCKQQQGAANTDLLDWAIRILDMLCEVYNSASELPFDTPSGDSSPGAAKLLLRSPRSMFRWIREEVFEAWKKAVSGEAARCTKVIREKTIPHLRAKAANVQDDGESFAGMVEIILKACMCELASASTYITNAIISYIAHDLVRINKASVQMHIPSLYTGKITGKDLLPLSERQDSDTVMSVGRKRAREEEEARLLYHWKAKVMSELAASMTRIMRSSEDVSIVVQEHGQQQVQQQEFRALRGCKLVQFVHGTFQLLCHYPNLMSTSPAPNVHLRSAIEAKLILHHVFILDYSGIQRLAKVLQWASHAMVTMPQAYDAIDAYVLSTCEDSMGKRAFMRAQCHHALVEFVLNLVHYKCFGSRKNLLVSASECLLQFVGHTLGSKLVSMMSTECTEPSAQRDAAALAIAKTMSTWSCIVMVESPPHLSQFAPVSSSESSLLRILQQTLHEAPWRTSKEHANVSQPLLDVLECMHSFKQVQGARGSDSEYGGKEGAKRFRQHVWDHCWRELAAKERNADYASHWTTMALFRPLLLDTFVLASNILGANACYFDQRISSL
jgi:hypothetical protein